MQIVYRLSPERPGGKPRPDWFSKQLCFRSMMWHFGHRVYDMGGPTEHLQLVTDGLLLAEYKHWQRQTQEFAGMRANPLQLDYREAGPAFLAALEHTCKSDQPDDRVVYFLEDDYLHRGRSYEAIYDGIKLGFDYVTLYDHPDKYLDKGPNPLVADGTEWGRDCGRLYLGARCHWKQTNSTTMTFACRLKTLRADAEIFRKHTDGKPMPQDFASFSALCSAGRRIGSAVPAFATHCESQWLAPLVDWAAVAWQQRQNYMTFVDRVNV